MSKKLAKNATSLLPVAKKCLLSVLLVANNSDFPYLKTFGFFFFFFLNAGHLREIIASSVDHGETLDLMQFRINRKNISLLRDIMIIIESCPNEVFVE